MSQAEDIKPLRADARRNRESLLVAAVELFNEGEKEVTLDAVARRAGVGIGTLYRHFPTRDALIEAAYRQEVAQLHDAASELLSELAPDAALAEWMSRYVGYAATKKGMRGALQSIVASETPGLFADTRAKMTDALTTLLDAGAEAGTLRADIDAEDVLLATSGIWQVADGPDWHVRAGRLIGLVVDGVRRT